MDTGTVRRGRTCTELRLIALRLVLDITRTRDGLYKGRLTVPGIDGEQDFTGILELLAIIEQQLHPDEQEDALPVEGASGPKRAGAPMRASRHDPPAGPEDRPADSGKH